MIHGKITVMSAEGMGMTTVSMKMVIWYATALPVHLADMMKRNEDEINYYSVCPFQIQHTLIFWNTFQDLATTLRDFSFDTVRKGQPQVLAMVLNAEKEQK